VGVALEEAEELLEGLAEELELGDAELVVCNAAGTPPKEIPGAAMTTRAKSRKHAMTILAAVR
jgi:hypothetical protein